MSNEICTRYLVVTLHDAAGEESDAVADYLEEQLTDGFTVNGTVTHALGLTLPPSVRVKVGPSGLDNARVYILDGAGHCTHGLDADEARQLAGALLRAAGDVDTANNTPTDQNGM